MFCNWCHATTFESSEFLWKIYQPVTVRQRQIITVALKVINTSNYNVWIGAIIIHNYVFYLFNWVNYRFKCGHIATLKMQNDKYVSALNKIFWLKTITQRLTTSCAR